MQVQKIKTILIQQSRYRAKERKTIMKTFTWENLSSELPSSQKKMELCEPLGFHYLIEGALQVRRTKCAHS
jgi:hypothetical protein